MQTLLLLLIWIITSGRILASQGHVSLFCLVKDTRVKQIDALDFVNDRHRYLFLKSALSLFLIRIRQCLHWGNRWYSKLFMIFRSWHNTLSRHIKFNRGCLHDRRLLFLRVVLNNDLLPFDITLWVEYKCDARVEISPELLIRVFPWLAGAFDCSKIDCVLSWQRDIACLSWIFYCIALRSWIVLVSHCLSL